MAKKKKTKTSQRTRQAKRYARTKVVFWIALILFLAPFAVFAWILISAAMDTGSPILGNRYEGDLDPAITKADLEAVKTAAENETGVEKVDVQLATATLRVYVDVDDNDNVESCANVARQVYSDVTNVLDPSVYFTQTDTKKMYDLEVHVYNYADQSKRDEDSFAYVIETKNSSMSDPVINTVSEPVNAELAEQLRQDVINRNNPTPTPSASAGGELTLGQEDTQEEDNQ